MYADNLREEVLDLSTLSQHILQFDPSGTGYVMQVVNFFNQGNLHLSLANLKVASDSYLPN